jgi:hypothetical protein
MYDCCVYYSKAIRNNQINQINIVIVTDPNPEHSRTSSRPLHYSKDYLSYHTYIGIPMQIYLVVRYVTV